MFKINFSEKVSLFMKNQKNNRDVTKETEKGHARSEMSLMLIALFVLLS